MASDNPYFEDRRFYQKESEDWIPLVLRKYDKYNLLVLVKEPEKYIFVYDDENRAKTMKKLGRFASNPDLNFTWYDAAVLSKKIRESKKKDLEEKDLGRGRFKI